MKSNVVYLLLGVVIAFVAVETVGATGDEKVLGSTTGRYQFEMLLGGYSNIDCVIFDPETGTANTWVFGNYQVSLQVVPFTPAP
ncbi:MAG: hypothetical protein HY706_20930 [Candidatus Hydrogenedentes bacterium]|nr:hypothetical protein [Candidatus Hydrogenedentota bacterium]